MIYVHYSCERLVIVDHQIETNIVMFTKTSSQVGPTNTNPFGHIAKVETQHCKKRIRDLQILERADNNDTKVLPAQGENV